MASGCDCGKIRYLTRKQARQAARTYKRYHVKLRVYQCPAGTWHLTSVTAQRMAQLREARG